ncbi:hypothetical protein QE377_002336 [Microbacterium sp. SORGH_AS 862]|nr:hypothetical protein [Microbacterium sp. SORGH_AS_0862]
MSRIRIPLDAPASCARVVACAGDDLIKTKNE